MTNIISTTPDTPAPAPPTTLSVSAAPPPVFWGMNGATWDTAVLVALAIAVVAAVLAFIATGGSIAVHKREARGAEDALERYKATADTRIAEANARAAEATSAAARLGLKVDALPAFVSDKERQVNALAERMEKSNERLEDARASVEASEARTTAVWNAVQKHAGARLLTTSQRSRFVDAVRGKLKTVLVRGFTSDIESLMYADDFVDALKVAGVDASFNPWGLFQWYTPKRGSAVSLLVLQYGHASAEAKSLADGLRAAGLQFETDVSEPDAAGGAVSLVILPKSPPSPEELSPVRAPAAG